jgi:hypothetical protein
MYENIINIAALVGVPILRSIAGWAENALVDRKVTAFEWKLLLETVVRVGAIGVFTYLGLNEAGIDISGLGAGASAFVMDKVLSNLKKYKVVK